ITSWSSKAHAWPSTVIPDGSWPKPGPSRRCSAAPMTDPFLAGRTGRGIRVAVVDSGISASHPHVARVDGGVEVCADGTLGSDTVDRLGHGTAVAAAIREKAPATELFAVKVFDRALATQASRLQRALEWASGSGIHLVNLSLGTRDPSHALPLG